MTRLQLQLRDAAEREARGARHPRTRRPGVPVAVRALAIGAAAAALLVLVVVLARDGDRPAPPVDRGPHLVRSVVLGESVSDIRGAFGSAWIYDGRAAQLLRVDPGDRRVAARLRAPRDATGIGLVASGDALFGGAAGTGIFRFDPRTDRVSWERPVPPDTEVTGLFAAGGRTWLGTQGGVRPFDPRTGRIGAERRIRAADPALFWWAVVDGVPWAARRDGTLLRLDPRTWRVTLETPLPDMTVPFGIVTAPGGGLVLGSKQEIRRVDPVTGRTAWRIVPSPVLQAWEVVGDRLWYAESGPGLPGARLVEADVRTGRVVGRVRLPLFDVLGIARVGDEIWATGNSGRVAIVRP